MHWGPKQRPSSAGCADLPPAWHASNHALNMLSRLCPQDVTWHEDQWDNPESRFLAFTLHDRCVGALSCSPVHAMQSHTLGCRRIGTLSSHQCWRVYYGAVGSCIAEYSLPLLTRRLQTTLPLLRNAGARAAAACTPPSMRTPSRCGLHACCLGGSCGAFHDAAACVRCMPHTPASRCGLALLRPSFSPKCPLPLPPNIQ